MYKYTCSVCGKKTEAESRKYNPTRCKKCREKSKDYKYYRDHKERLKSARADSSAMNRMKIELTCRNCGKKFHARNTLKQKYCSEKCMRAFNRDNCGKQCCVNDCSRPVRARGMCSMHWRRWARATGREKNPVWDDRRRSNYEIRRARKKSNGRVEDFQNVDVYERDNWICGVCGLKVDPCLRWPDPMSASLDHIIPLSRGGSHTLDNVQLAHLVCNERKSASV